jgi:phenylpropionate dioxygenase-like ring-hydroxylating dioxygenase large terminal subunit
MTVPVTPPARRIDFVPAEDYRGRDQARLEAERMWPRVWQMACREADLPEVGSFVRYDILDDSILVVRTGDGADDIVAYYNVCQHRGRELREAPRGKLDATLGCRFHGWRWSLDGQFRSAYQAEDWAGCPDFDAQALSLPRVKVGCWGGWVWINQDPKAEPLLDYLGVVPEILDPFEPEAMRPLWWKTILAPVNWKIVAEAFNEGYHSWSTHDSGINYFNSCSPTAAHGRHGMFFSAAKATGEYRADDGEWRLPRTPQENLWANNRHIFRTLFALTLDPGMAVSETLLTMPDVAPEALLPTMFELYVEEYARRDVTFPRRLDIAAWSRAGTDWHIFPNSIVLPSLDGALWYRIRPDRDPDRCIFDIWSFGRFAPGAEPRIEQEIFNGFEAFRGQCPFLEEDFANMEAVNRGVKNRGFSGARTNPVQEVSVSNFHAALAAYLASPPADQ